MKKMMTLLSLCLLALTASAQARYGTIHYDALLSALPEYAQAQQELTTLKAKYQSEVAYNETAFKRQFAEFLQGQKDFPQSILLKRQRDLQEAMEKGVAYRQTADSLLLQAEKDLMHAAHKRLNAAISEVGQQRGYDMIVNLDADTYPYLNAQLTEDATPYVEEILTATAKK